MSAILIVEGNPKSSCVTKVTAPVEIWTHLIALQRKYSPDNKIERKKRFLAYSGETFVPQFCFPLELKNGVLHFRLDVAQWEKTRDNSLMWANSLFKGWTMEIKCKKGYVINKLIHGYKYSAVEIDFSEERGCVSV